MNDLNDSGPRQLGFNLDDPTRSPSYEPDRDEVRSELVAILEIARGATDEAPWDARTFLYHRVVFPQMAGWLPDEERDQLCFAFAKEVARIDLLMAA